MIEATRLFTLIPIDQHLRPSVVSAMAKYHMTEMGRVVVNEAMDVHGGRGIMLGQNNYLARCYTSIPISITVEGANILTRNLIIFGQGAIRCHPYIQQEMLSMTLEDKAQGLKLFDKALFSHIKYSLSNIARLTFHSLTVGLFCIAPAAGRQNAYFRQLTRMSIALSLVSDLALVLLGGKLKRAERLSARLGDVLSYLYLGTAVLKYYIDFGNKEDDLPYVDWCLQTCLFQIQKAFLSFFDNFHFRLIGGALRWMVFPFGRSYAEPNDTVEHILAASMTRASTFRDRLTQHFFQGSMPKDPIASLEETFKQMLESSAIQIKFEMALKNGLIPKHLSKKMQLEYAVSNKLLTEEDSKVLSQYDKLLHDAIRVDEFTNEQLAGK